MREVLPDLAGSETPTQQENRIASEIGGKRIRGSGSSKFAKSDIDQATGVSFDPLKFRGECKRTDKKSMSIKGSWLGKITREAMAEGKEPCVIISIDGDRDPMAERDWVLMPVSVFKRLQRGLDNE